MSNPLLFQPLVLFGTRDVSKTSWKRVTKNSLTRWYVLKSSWRHLWKTSWKCLEDVLKMFWRSFCKTSWKRLSKTSWTCLKGVLKTYWKLLEDLLKMSWRRFCKTFWRHIENVLNTSWRRITKINKLVLIKKSWSEYIRLD